MIFISAMILRKRIPEEELKFKIPGGFGFLAIICIMPCIIAFVAFFINGTDYFIGGMIGIISGPILYYIWKRMYGGLAKNDPVNHPLNPKTKLAVGDTKRMAFTFGLLSVMGFIGYPFLRWFEGDWYGEWGPEYYAEENAGVPLLSDFDMMLNVILGGAIVLAVVAIIFGIIAAKVEPKKVKAA